MLSQTARWISEICVPSSLFSSRFYVCSESDFEDLFTAGGALGPMSASNRSAAAETAKELLGVSASQCPEVSDSLIEFARLLMIWLMDLRVQGYEPFVPFEGLEQLHRFLFILGITHVAYSFVTVVLSMIKVTWLSSLWHMEAGFLSVLTVALFTEVELPTAPDHSHDRVLLHGTHWYLHLDFFLGGI
ncbi:hypothetical protein BHE74_00054345 [Ensete ventricosum]|nr:hypothetical protein BHE74_00054345 [Ensete ventricosum]